MEEKKIKRLPNKTIAQTKKYLARKEEAADINSNLEEINRQAEVISQKFIADPTPFFAEREKEIAKVIEKYGDLQNEDLQNGIITKKDYTLKLTEYLVKPMIPRFGVVKQHTASSLQFTSDFYWEKIVLPLSEKVEFIPNIYDLFSLLGISKKTFDNYSQNGDERMRETCEIILDKFIAYYQRKGMKKEVSEIMTMFVLKTTYKQRENDTPQVVVANIDMSPQEKIDKYARQYGFEKWSED